jgi:hypothetical protein
LQDGHENIVGEMGWALEAAQSFHSNHFTIQHYSPEHIFAQVNIHIDYDSRNVIHII